MRGLLLPKGQRSKENCGETCGLSHEAEYAGSEAELQERPTWGRPAAQPQAACSCLTDWSKHPSCCLLAVASRGGGLRG